MFGNFPELGDDHNNNYDVMTAPKGQDAMTINESTDSGDDAHVRANGEAFCRPASSLGRPFQAVFVPQVEANPAGSAESPVQEWPEADPFDIFDSYLICGH